MTARMSGPHGGHTPRRRPDEPIRTEGDLAELSAAPEDRLSDAEFAAFDAAIRSCRGDDRSWDEGLNPGQIAAIRHRAITAASYAEWHQVGHDVRALAAEVERLRGVETEMRATVRELRADAADEHSRLSQQLDNAEEARPAMAGQTRDLSGWTAAEDAEFDQLYGVEAAMYLRAANSRVWLIVHELRLEAASAGRDPYQDSMAQRLSAALVGTDSETGTNADATLAPDQPEATAEGPNIKRTNN